MLDGVVAPSSTVAAYAHRVQTVKGFCRARGCSRRVELEPKALCERGLGQLDMRQVQNLWRCQRIDGCGLAFRDEPMLNPLLLGQFVGRPNVRLRLRCQADGCGFHRLWRVEEVIAGLDRRCQDGARTRVATLGQAMTSGCPMCKKVNWTAELLWINTASMGWKALGERSFEPREAR